MKLLTTKLREAIARGWCAKGNSFKEMDFDLAEAILDEVLSVVGSIEFDERECCAKVADAARKDDLPMKETWLVAFDIANSIRARSFAKCIAINPPEECLTPYGEEIELIAETMVADMFSVHELPVMHDIAEKYRATAKLVIEALRIHKIKTDCKAYNP